MGVGSVRAEVLVGDMAGRFGQLAAELPSSVVLVIAYEKSSRYVEAAVITGVAAVALALVVILPGSRRFRLVRSWASGGRVDVELRWKTRTSGRVRPVSEVCGPWRFGAYCCHWRSER